MTGRPGLDPRADAALGPLREQARVIRTHVVRMVASQGQGYVQQGLGATDLFTALSFHEMRLDVDDPNWPERDRLLMVPKALAAADRLAAEGIDAAVVNVHTIKPLDEVTVCELAGGCGAIVSAENHSIIGGLGDAISHGLQANNVSVSMVRVGVADTFAEGASTPYLFRTYGLEVEHVVAAAERAVAGKG